MTPFVTSLVELPFVPQDCAEFERQLSLLKLDLVPKQLDRLRLLVVMPLSLANFLAK